LFRSLTPLRISWRINVDCVVEERVSQDIVIDSRGEHVLEFCIGDQIGILNGGTCGDSNGKYVHANK
jgi:hypothetical protein